MFSSHANVKDVLILGQFLKKDGNIMTFQESQLCGRKYFLVKQLIKKAQICKLLPRPSEWEVYGAWDELNTYHDWPPRYRDQPMKIIQKHYWQ